MTWVSLICLLALSSSAFSRSVAVTGYGGYGATPVPEGRVFLSGPREHIIQRPVLQSVSVQSDGYGQPAPLPLTESYSSAPKLVSVSSYGQSFDTMPRIAQFELTPADALCRGRLPETVIPIEDGRKFVVCLDDGKGVEQSCPRNLFYHEISRRCERKYGPMENVCASQPCLHGGLCVQDGSTYQCQCTPGYDGKTCELDSRACQSNPCGQSPDARCQSFRWGAALPYVCIFQDGLAYGVTPQQVIPSPCLGLDGPHALVISDKGFIMCDGERMFIESCPGGTLWDDLNKACTWPDMQVIAPAVESRVFSSYGASLPVQHIERTRLVSSYSDAPVPQPIVEQRHILERPRLVSSYGTALHPVSERIRHVPFLHSGPKLIVERPKLLNSYGEVSLPQPVQEQQIASSYGTEFTVPKVIVERPRLTSSY